MWKFCKKIDVNNTFSMVRSKFIGHLCPSCHWYLDPVYMDMSGVTALARY